MSTRKKNVRASQPINQKRDSYSAPLQWLRLWTDFVHDSKVQMLDEAMQRRYVMLLCYTALRVIPTLDDASVAFALRLSLTETKRTKKALIRAGLIGNDWKPLAWDRRQFVSDHNAAERKRRQRERERRQRDADGKADRDVTSESRDSHALEQNRAEQNHRTEKDTEEISGNSSRVRGNGASKPEPIEHSPEFKKLRELYPRIDRKGQPDWGRAERMCIQLIENGAAWSDLEKGVKRYARFVERGGSTPDCVYSPTTFFDPNDPDRPWSQEWKL